MEARAGGGDTGKAPSVAADEAGARVRHWARPTQRGRSGGMRGKKAGKTSGVWDDNRGCEATGVSQESPRVGDNGVGRKASGVAENPQGSCQGVGGGVESPRVNSTPIVT